MHRNRTIGLCLMSLLLVITSLALAQENGNGEQEQEEEGDGEEPEFRMSIVHQGPGQGGAGLEALYPDQAREVEAGEDVFTGLFLPHGTPGQQGGAVIIPDTGQSPARGLPAGLRRALPESGWSTLAISLPQSTVDPMPERVFGTRSDAAKESGSGDDDGDGEDEGDNGDENGDDSSAMTIEVTQGQSRDAASERDESWQEAGMARVGAAVQMMRNEGVENLVLIGIGDGADLALRYVQTNADMFPPGGVGLVWLDARFRPPYDRRLDEELGEGYAIPVLDLYDRGRTGDLAPARREAARRGGFERFTQSALPLPRQSRRVAEKRVGSWVAGWLNKTMAGMETQ